MGPREDGEIIMRNNSICPIRNMAIGIVAAFAIVLSWQTLAGPFEEGVAAEEKYDFPTAVQEYEKAAAVGNVKAQSRLGMMYALGEGVRVNDVEAHMWFIIAAQHGATVERRRRDIMAKRLYDFEIVKAKKRAEDWMEKNRKP
jgi:TPR repeat protein